MSAIVWIAAGLVVWLGVSVSLGLALGRMVALADAAEAHVVDDRPG